MRILLVDDDAASRTRFAEELELAGHPDLVEAGSADDALRLLRVGDPDCRQSSIDVVLMKATLPAPGSRYALQRIRSSEPLRDLPVMLLVDSVDARLEEALQAGATDFIRLPVDRIELRARVGAVVRWKQEVDARMARERELAELERRLEEANKVLEQLAALDPVTGLANRSHLDMVLQREWRRATRMPSPLSVLLIEVDSLARLSESSSPEEADLCLAAIGRAVARCLNRTGDIVGRFAKSEFLVILPNTPAQGAVGLAEAMRGAVASLALPHPSSDVGPCVTIAVGVSSTLPTPDGLPSRLLAAADHALHDARQAGPNRMVVHPLD